MQSSLIMPLPIIVGDNYASVKSCLKKLGFKKDLSFQKNCALLSETEQAVFCKVSYIII